jgi:hypothetical protein
MHLINPIVMPVRVEHGELVSGLHPARRGEVDVSFVEEDACPRLRAVVNDDDVSRSSCPD